MLNYLSPFFSISLCLELKEYDKQKYKTRENGNKRKNKRKNKKFVLCLEVVINERKRRWKCGKIIHKHELYL